MRNKNWMIVLIALALVAAVAAAALLVKAGPQTPDEPLKQAAGYVYITAGQEGRWFELPEKETSVSLKRTAADGREICNVVALTPDGAYMATSTCENQDCVNQGHVTLTNKKTRVLQNMVLCLPNEVTIQLYSAEELAQMEQQ